MNLLDKPILTATLGDFCEAWKLVNPTVEDKPRKLAYGIAGLAAILDCSVPTAQKLKNSGAVPYMQKGRKVVFDVDKVLESLKR
jgi:hypothetical protein